MALQQQQQQQQQQQLQHVTNELLQEVEREIALIPDETKVDYLTAKARVPQLVATESSPLRFLRHHDFVASKAAMAVVDYWRYRKRIFGDRAFLPIAISPGGALLDEEIELIRSAYLAILPNDSFGRTVVVSDFSRRLEKGDRDQRLRAAFFHCQVASENERTQTDGIVFLILAHEIMPDAVNREVVKLFTKIFPGKFHSVHIVDFIWNTSWIHRGAINLLNSLMGPILRSIRVHLHERKPRNELLQNLNSHGMFELPSVVGGKWTYLEGLSRSLKERVELEKVRYTEFLVASRRSSPGTNTAVFSQPQSFRFHENIHYKDLEMALEILPQDERNVYLRAKNAAPPSVWERECISDAFLCAEHWNAYLASKRMVRYLKLRLETFGGHLKPLNQTAEDGLDHKDTKLLSSGFLMLLPDDTTGSPVIWIDFSRLPHRLDISSDESRRCLIYMFSVLVESKKAQAPGAVILFSMMRSLDLQRSYLEFLDSLVDALPMRVKAVHLVSLEMVPDNVSSKLDFGESLHVHADRRREHLASSLGSHGLRKEHLPREFHGGFAYARFVEWQELRTRMEWQIPLGLSGRNLTELFPSVQNGYPLLSNKDKDQQIERKRRLNVMHSRRKRDRVRLERHALQDEVFDLEEHQEYLVKEGERLNLLVIRASAVVDQINR